MDSVRIKILITFCVIALSRPKTDLDTDDFVIAKLGL